MLTNMDKLYESVAANGPVCVGLDTEIGVPASQPSRSICGFTNRLLTEAEFRLP